MISAEILRALQHGRSNETAHLSFEHRLAQVCFGKEDIVTFHGRRSICVVDSSGRVRATRTDSLFDAKNGSSISFVHSITACSTTAAFAQIGKQAFLKIKQVQPAIANELKS